MKPLFFVLIVAIVCISSSAYSSDPQVPTKSADLEEQLKQLTEKLEDLEKRLAALEVENKELREAIAQPRVRVIQAPPQKKENRPKFHLLDHTELGVPFSVERAMLGDAYQQEFNLRQIGPQHNDEYRIEPQATPTPEFRLKPKP